MAYKNRTTIIHYVEWVSDCCLMPTQQFSAISWREQVNFQWDDDELRFVLDQHVELDFYSASSLKQQSMCRHVAPLWHIMTCHPTLTHYDISPHSDTLWHVTPLWHIIPIPSQPVFALSPSSHLDDQPSGFREWKLTHGRWSSKLIEVIILFVGPFWV